MGNVKLKSEACELKERNGCGSWLAGCSARPKIQANLSLQTIMELAVDEMCSSWKSLTIAAHQEGGS